MSPAAEDGAPPLGDGRWMSECRVCESTQGGHEDGEDSPFCNRDTSQDRSDTKMLKYNFRKVGIPKT